MKSSLDLRFVHLSDEFFPTFALPIFSDHEDGLFCPEYENGKITGFAEYTQVHGRTFEFIGAPQKSVSIGGSAIYVIAFSTKDIRTFTLAEAGVLTSDLLRIKGKHPFFAMELSELLGDRTTYLESAVDAARLLQSTGPYLLNIWLHSGNVDDETLALILDKLNNGGQQKFDEPIARLTVSGPSQYICALREVVLGSGSSLAEGSLRLNFPRSTLDSVFAMQNLLSAMRTMSFEEFCALVRVSFVHPLNVEAAMAEYNDRFANIDSLDLLLSIDQRNRVADLLKDFTDHPLFQCSEELLVSRLVACALVDKTPDIMTEYEKFLTQDAESARTGLLEAIKDRTKNNNSIALIA